MAKGKTKPKARATAKSTAKATSRATSKPKSPAPSASKAAFTQIVAPSVDRVELAMLAWRPQLESRMRDAFRSQCSDARAEELGLVTKAVGVLAEARQWCTVIERTLTHLVPGQTVRYSADRLTWLLENVAALADTIASEGGRAAGAGSAAGTAAVSEQRARARRNDLLLALQEIADGNATLETELAAARGTSETPTAVLASLRELASLGLRWATSFDPNIHALTESVGLTRADLGAALGAADALEGAPSGKTTSPARSGKDSAAVNRIEGRVLFEMGKAMAPINDAAARGIGDKLTPGPATSRVLSRRASP
jgi:hypothetical protein